MQVLVRKPQLNGDPRMVRADVLSRDGSNLKIIFVGDQLKKVHIIKASDVVPESQVFGTQQTGDRTNPVIKAFPTNRNALGYPR